MQYKNRPESAFCRLGIISYDKQLLSLCRTTALSYGVDVKIFSSLAEFCVRESSGSMLVLVIDMDANSDRCEDISNRLENLTNIPSVILVGGTDLSPWNSALIPKYVKRVIVREGGHQSLRKALRDLLSSTFTTSSRSLNTE